MMLEWITFYFIALLWELRSATHKRFAHNQQSVIVALCLTSERFAPPSSKQEASKTKIL